MIESKIVDSHVETYIRSLLPQATGLLGELELFAEANHVPIIHPEVAQHIKVLFKLIKPKRVLEIGTAIGYSASIMATEMESGHIDTIELSDAMVFKATETVEKLRPIVPDVSVTIHQGNGLDILQQLKNQKYDLIFIDAAKGHYQAFYDLCFPMLNKGGLIVSDNVLYKGMVATNLYLVRRKITIVKRMRKYLKYISTDPRVETTILPIGDGLALSYKKEE